MAYEEWRVYVCGANGDVCILPLRYAVDRQAVCFLVKRVFPSPPFFSFWLHMNVWVGGSRKEGTLLKSWSHEIEQRMKRSIPSHSP